MPYVNDLHHGNYQQHYGDKQHNSLLNNLPSIGRTLHGGCPWRTGLRRLSSSTCAMSISVLLLRWGAAVRPHLGERQKLFRCIF